MRFCKTRVKARLTLEASERRPPIPRAFVGFAGQARKRLSLPRKQQPRPPLPAPCTRRPRRRRSLQTASASCSFARHPTAACVAC